jgi:hypothetical protein
MQRINTPNGLFAGGDPATNTKGTLIAADWLNAVQEEILAVIEEAELDPTNEDLSQLLQAISKIFAQFGIFSSSNAYSGDILADTVMGKFVPGQVYYGSPIVTNSPFSNEAFRFIVYRNSAAASNNAFEIHAWHGSSAREARNQYGVGTIQNIWQGWKITDGRGALPSNEVINSTFPASNPGTIISPIDGYICAAVSPTTIGDYITLSHINPNNHLQITIVAAVTSRILYTYLPVARGQGISVGWQGNSSWINFTRCLSDIAGVLS